MNRKFISAECHSLRDQGGLQALPLDGRGNGSFALQSSNPKIPFRVPNESADDFVERSTRNKQAQWSSFKEATLSDLFWRYRFGDNEKLAELMRPVDEAR